MGPLRGALERQAILGNITRNPFELVRPLKETNVAIKQARATQSKQSVVDLNEPLPAFDLNGCFQEEGEVDPFNEQEVLLLSRIRCRDG